MARPMVYNSETRYTMHVEGTGTPMEFFFRYLFSLPDPISEYNTRI